jgi:hypothetical protein
MMLHLALMLYYLMGYFLKSSSLINRLFCLIMLSLMIIWMFCYSVIILHCVMTNDDSFALYD